jgi:hypothetical protein
MKSILDELTTDLERAESLQNQLISIATGGPGLPYEYQELRRYFVDSPVYNSLSLLSSKPTETQISFGSLLNMNSVHTLIGGNTFGVSFKN